MGTMNPAFHIQALLGGWAADMNEFHSPGTKPALWLRIPQQRHQACLGNGVPGSKEVSCEAGCQAGTLHEMTDELLAPLGSLCGRRLGVLRWWLPVIWQGVAQGGTGPLRVQ